MTSKFLFYLTAILQLTNSLLAQDLDKVNVKFYNGLTSQAYSQFSMNNLTQLLKESKFSHKRPTTLIITGWMMNPTAESTLLLVDGYLNHRDHNLILLDWSDYSVGLYTPVMYKMSKISRGVGRYFVKLFRQGLSDKTFHCLGHSFGSHSCGIIGREVQQYSNNKYKFGRITGLDPAGPNFFPPIKEIPLNKNDASFVDTIHSDTFFIGTKNPIGHVSFFPNFNMVQPGCPSFSLTSFFDYINDMCSHFHAMRYYADTINPKNCKMFPARRCADWKKYQAHACDDEPINYMGIDANPNIRGQFYVKVSSNRYFDGKEFYDWLVDRIGDRFGNFFGFGALSDSRIYSQYYLSNITKLLSHSHFDNNRPTTLYIFGWLQSPIGDTTWQLIDAYIKRGGYNFLVLDWSKYNVDLYSIVMYRMSKMSRIFGKTLVKLFNIGLNDQLFHCVGHSFGAHSCGIMGREVQKVSNGRFKFGRITGLDPAKWNFFPPVYENPLNPKDAHFVDTIQTDNFFVGAIVPLGHASFFPNNGAPQPGCPGLKTNSFYNYLSSWCSHFNANRYWTETLNPKNTFTFPARKCLDWTTYKSGSCNNNPINYMGLNATANVPGVFYLQLQTSKKFNHDEFYYYTLSRIGERVLDVLLNELRLKF